MRSFRFLAAFCAALSCSTAAAADPLKVAVTTPDLGNLASQVGGEAVEVTAFVKGGQDPHFVEARPSFVRVLSKSDLFVTVGLGLESGWVPALLRSARNPRIRPGGSGALDASRGIPLLGVRAGGVDRSQGDVHAAGNPHYLLDPVNGLRVARALEERLSALRPERAEYFAARSADFERRLLVALVGAELVTKHGATVVAAAVLEEGLEKLVAAGGAAEPETKLGGWLGRMLPHRGAAVVADHELWPYFARRFGLEVAELLEPLPGITPTTRHLGVVVARMKSDGIRAILSAAYFHPRYAHRVAEATGATVVGMANQVGARDGVDDYIEMIDWNVRRVADAL